MKCSVCGRGAEACRWCGTDDVADGICDCGLVDFGEHLLDCEARAGKRWVVCMDRKDVDVPL